MQHIIWESLRVLLLFWAAVLTLLFWIVTVGAIGYGFGAISKLRENDKKPAVPITPVVNKDLR